MKALRRTIHRLRGILVGRRLERELEEELQSHIEMETEDNLRRGMAPEIARREALLKFGGSKRSRRVIATSGARPCLKPSSRICVRTPRIRPQSRLHSHVVGSVHAGHRRDDWCFLGGQYRSLQAFPCSGPLCPLGDALCPERFRGRQHKFISTAVQPLANADPTCCRMCRHFSAT